MKAKRIKGETLRPSSRFRPRVRTIAVAMALCLVPFSGCDSDVPLDDDTDGGVEDEREIAGLLPHKNCNTEQLSELLWIRDYLTKYKGVMENGVVGKTKRRRIRNRIANHHFHCNSGMCSRIPSWGIHFGGVFNPGRSQICVDAIRDAWGGGWTDVCTLTGVVAHEFGHAVGTKICGLLKHNRGECRDDETYRLGYRMEDHCRQKLGGSVWKIGTKCKLRSVGSCAKKYSAPCRGCCSSVKNPTKGQCLRDYRCKWVSKKKCTGFPPIP